MTTIQHRKRPFHNFHFVLLKHKTPLAIICISLHFAAVMQAPIVRSA